MQMPNCSLAILIRSLDAHDVMPRFGKTMFRHRVAVFGVLFDITVRFHRDLLAPVPEVPDLVPKSRSETSHFEDHRIARVDVSRRRKSRVDRGRQLIWRGLVNYEHDREIIIHLTTLIGNCDHFTVLTGASVT